MTFWARQRKVIFRWDGGSWFRAVKLKTILASRCISSPSVHTYNRVIPLVAEYIARNASSRWNDSTWTDGAERVRISRPCHFVRPSSDASYTLLAYTLFRVGFDNAEQ